MSRDLEDRLGQLYIKSEFDAAKLVEKSEQIHKTRNRRKWLSSGIAVIAVTLAYSINSTSSSPKIPGAEVVRVKILEVETSSKVGAIQIGEMYGEVLNSERLGSITSFNQPVGDDKASGLFLNLNLPGFESCGWQTEIQELASGNVIFENMQSIGKSMSGVNLDPKALEPHRYIARASCVTDRDQSFVDLELSFRIRELKK